jgi:hypothetical protein
MEEVLLRHKDDEFEEGLLHEIKTLKETVTCLTAEVSSHRAILDTMIEN